MRTLRPVAEFEVRDSAKRAIGEGALVELSCSEIGPVTLLPPNSISALLTNADVEGPRGGAGIGVLPPSKQRLRADAAFDRIAHVLRTTFRELLENVDETRRQSRILFRLFCIFSSVGFLLVLAAIYLALDGRAQTTIITVAASAVADFLAAVFYIRDRDLHARLDKYHGSMANYVKFLAMIDVAETMANATERDKLKEKIIDSLLAPETDTA